MNNNRQDYYVQYDLIKNDFMAIHKALKHGHPSYCIYRLNKIKRESRSRILSQKYTKGEEVMTLLIDSILNSQYSVVMSLVDNGVNLNAKGKVRLFSSLIDGVTPLWCAAACGHVSIIKYLIKRGAIVNKCTKYKSTPLLAACYKGSIECVQYLVKKGAKYNMPCLTIASSNAITPILVAAEKNHYAIVNYLLAELKLTQKNIIEGYELLGASLIINKYKSNYEQGFSALLKAMEIRCQHHIWKQPCKQVAAYNNQKECETVQALLRLRYSPEALHYESLIIRQRIFGENNQLLLPAIITRGISCAISNEFVPCLNLWTYALQISQSNGYNAPIYLTQFTEVFSKINEAGIQFGLFYLEIVLSYVVYQFKMQPNKSARNLKNKEFFMANMYGTVALIVYIGMAWSDLENPLAKKIIANIMELNKMNLRSDKNQTLLHMCLDPDTSSLCDGNPYRDIHEIVILPDYMSSKLLIFCGADVNALDNNQSTPLHYIIQILTEYPFIERGVTFYISAIIQELLDAGADTDIINHHGICPFNSHINTGILKSVNTSPRKLTCLAACALKYNFEKKYFCDKLPEIILDFIDLH